VNSAEDALDYPDVYVDDTGRLGIQTDSPEAILHMVDNSGYQFVYERYNNGAGGGNFTLRKSRGVPTAPLTAVSGDGAFNLNGSIWDGSAWNDVGTVNIHAQTITGTVASGAFNISLKDISGVTQNRFAIDEEGNVGVSTDSPDARLHVIYDTPLSKSYTPWETVVIENDGTSALAITGGSGSNCYVNFGNAESTDIGRIGYRHSVDEMHFRTNGSIQMRIGSAGNVGIGLTPAYPLDVAGDCNITGSYLVNGAAAVMQTNSIQDNTPPSSATDTGTSGDVAYDNDYIYICTATNTWRRTAISTW